MRAVAYCRVSTKKEEQLDSLESQEKFFEEYSEKYGFELVCIYADEGKSGTKMKNRTELLKLLNAATFGEFELVLIKDISRLARNTVDFLTSIRTLKALGIKVVFVNYDQTSSESSEFMLTMLSAIAQEESANTSKRVKFGKKQNAKLGRVPNLIFGYDKIPGEYFRLRINEEEAETVRRIFKLYTQKEIGASKIADILNRDRILTKRGCSWSQASICRILCNDIYTGKVINGKEEVEDYLTGKRKRLQKDNWYITYKPELQIIEEETLKAANHIRESRRTGQTEHKVRESKKHSLSQLIVCRQCGGYFRRLTRTYKNTFITWVCSTRNLKGADSCNNNFTIHEEEVLEVIHSYFINIFEESPSVRNNLLKEAEVIDSSLIQQYLQELKSKINKKERERVKYIELYSKEIITFKELQERSERFKEELWQLQEQLIKTEKTEAGNCRGQIAPNTPADEKNKVENYIVKTFSANSNLRSIVDRIEADGTGNICIYLKSIPTNRN